MDIPQHAFTVPNQWCDYNEHFSDCYYLIPFSAGLDHVLDSLGLGRQYRGRYSVYTVESRIRYLHEAKQGDQLVVSSSVKDGDQKRLWTSHQMQRNGQVIATCEFVCLHVEVSIPKSTPFPDAIAQKIQSRKIILGNQV